MLKDEEIKIESEFSPIVVEPTYNNLSEFATAYNPSGIDLYKESLKERIVPDLTSLNSSRSISRNNLPVGKGLWQIAVRAERDTLRKGMARFADDIVAKTNSRYVTKESLIDLVNYLPNYNFPYYNKLIKRSLEGIANGRKTTSQADYRHIQSLNILNSAAEYTFLALLNRSLDPEMIGYSVNPPKSKSGLDVQYDRQNKPFLSLANPGDVYLSQDSSEKQYDTSTVDKIIRQINDNISRMQDEITVTSELEPLYAMPDTTLNAVTKSLLYFRDKILDRHLSLSDLDNISHAIDKYLGYRRSKYLLSLSKPFEHRTARVPMLISPPSATFSVRSIAPLTTNALGNVAFVFMPFGLYATGSDYGSLAINNNVALTGTGISNFFLGVSTGHMLPAALYTRYRLVSAGLRVYAYPSSNNDNGMLTVSVTFDPVTPTVVPGTMTGSAQYGNFSLIENGYFKQTTTIASRQVQDHVYLPMDESHWDFQNLNQVLGDFAWVGYITGAAASTSIARIEVVTNFEALVDNEYTDYLPSESPMQDVDPKTVFAAIQAMKNSGQPLTTSSVQSTLDNVNLGIAPDTEIRLPPTQKETGVTKKTISMGMEVVKDLVADTLSKLPASGKSSWLSSIFQSVSPMIGSLISSVASKYIPSFLFGKF